MDDGKFNTLPRTEEEQIKVDRLLKASLDQYFDCLSKPKHAPISARGDYIVEDNSVLLRSQKGLPRGFGRHKKQGRILTAHEALFLFETEIIQIYHRDVPLSLAEAYHLLIQNRRQFLEYATFQHLTRVGLCVLDHHEHDHIDSSTIVSKKGAASNTSITRRYYPREDLSDSLSVLSMKGKCHAVTPDILACPESQLRRVVTDACLKLNQHDRTITNRNVGMVFEFDQIEGQQTLPSSHYWSSTVPSKTHPLVRPNELSTMTMEYLCERLKSAGPIDIDDLSIDKSATTTADIAHTKIGSILAREERATSVVKVRFDVYFKDTFDKRGPNRARAGKPDAHVIVTSNNDDLPSLNDVISTSQDATQCDSQVPTRIYSIVDDNGSVCFYGLLKHPIVDQYPELWKQIKIF